MARRRRGFQLPTLLEVPPALVAASAAEAFDRGQNAEDEFDYEAARDLYRLGVKLAQPGQAADALSRYCHFLVERYGQFTEVAQWLDSPGFDPLAGADIGLSSLVAIAAVEANHPGAEALDQRLAVERGQPEATARVARRWLEQGLRDKARALLEENRARFAPTSGALKLLESLRREDEDKAAAQLVAVREALDEGKVESASQTLDALRPALGATSAFRGLQTEVRAAAARAAVAVLRAQQQAERDAGQFEAASATLQRWLSLEPESAEAAEAERQLRSEQDAQLRQTLTTQLDGAAPEELRGLLLQAWSVWGAEFEAPSSVEERWRRLVEILESVGYQGDSKQAIAQLGVLDALQPLVEGEDLDSLEQVLQRLAAQWRQAPLATRAAEKIERLHHARALADEAAVVAEVEALLSAQRYQQARAALDARPRARWVDGATLKRLRAALDVGRRDFEHRERLLEQFQGALERGRLFDARRALTALRQRRPEVDVELSDDLRRLAEREKQELSAKPAPPFGLKLEAAPFASAVYQERIHIVQGRLWLSVGLADGGLSPYLMPEDFELVAAPAAQLAPFSEGLRLIGCTQEQLIVVEHRPGLPPKVVQARALEELVDPQSQVVAWALEPAAPTITALVRSAKQTSSLLRLDPQTLQTEQHERFKPALRDIVAIEGQRSALGLCAELNQRGRGPWALATMDAAGRLGAQWSQQELNEPIAGLRRAVAWPAEERVYASYDLFDLFDAAAVSRPPSLAVWRGQQLLFASSDLRRRFAPTDKVLIDHPWALDPAAGRLWFAALPRTDHDEQDAMLLGVDARTLRPQPLLKVPGAARVLAIHGLEDGAAALVRSHEGKHMWARVDANTQNRLTLSPLPV